MNVTQMSISVIAPHRPYRGTLAPAGEPPENVVVFSGTPTELWWLADDLRNRVPSEYDDSRARYMINAADTIQNIASMDAMYEEAQEWLAMADQLDGNAATEARRKAREILDGIM